MNTAHDANRSRSCRLGLALAMLAFGGPVIFAQTNVSIERMDTEVSQIRVLVNHPVAGSTNFTLQGTTNLGNWSSIPGSTVSVLDNGRIELRIPRPIDPLRFFRVLANISTNDVDADGLPTEVELSLGTNPNKVDTDGDGISDGLELVAGTDPLDPNSFPRQNGLPVASFTNSVSLATEGAGSHLVTVTFDRPFAGNLYYTINPRSSAVAGRDYQALSGSVPVAGTVAQIVITPINDLVVRQERMLLLDLTELAGAGYRIGIRSSHVVRVADDDAYWNGTLKDKYAERNFRLMLSRSNSVTLACFVAGQGFDGLPILNTNAPGTSISEGIIPVGCSNAVVHADSAALFSISSPPLPAGNGGLFAANVALARTFDFVCMATNSAHVINPAMFVGTYTERIGIANTPSSYLDRTNTGILVLVRDLPTRPAITNGVVLP